MRKDKVYVDISSDEEVEAMGELIDELNLDEDKGNDVSMVYYFKGLKQFDEILKDNKFYDFGLTFHLSSYENAFAFVLYDLKNEEFVNSIAIWRDCISDDLRYSNDNVFHNFVHKSTFISLLKSGAIAVDFGIAGMAITSFAGRKISKLRGVKVKSEPAYEYFLKYAENEVEIYSKKRNAHIVLNFLHKHFRKELSKDTINNSDTRCFIASACYGNADSIKLMTFRNFRDNKLRKTLIGRAIIYIYYKVSPFLIKHLNGKKKYYIRKFLLNRIYDKIK